MMSDLSTQERFKRGAPDAGRHFAFMSDKEPLRTYRIVVDGEVGRVETASALEAV